MRMVGRRRKRRREEEGGIEKIDEKILRWREGWERVK